jgi:3,4-dihydroxy 2-butanone 4-phosphate synthase/GTP cyclohydrolase II
MTSPPSIKGTDDLDRHLQAVHSAGNHNGRPFTLVSYAQCLDGSIATIDRRPLAISGRAAMTLTHRLRDLFEGILIGINTLLTDDPRLTVRLVDGANPRPVVLDTHLRTPASCRLVQRNDRAVWLASAANQSEGRQAALTRAGAVCLPCSLNSRGQIELHALLQKLYDRGIHSLMVEGGAQVITSFIRARLADLFIITVSPALVGGLQAVDGRSTAPLSRLPLTDIHYERMEDDLIVWAKPGKVNE